jgi:hypothetical protein
MSKSLSAIIVLASIAVILALLVYAFLAFKASGAKKQIEELNKMADSAKLSVTDGGKNMILQFDINQSLNPLQIGTINNYTDQIIKMYQENFDFGNQSIYQLIGHQDSNGMRNICINIDFNELKNDSELKKKCVEKNSDFANLNFNDRQKIILDCVKEKMKEFGGNLLKKENETSIFLKPFKPNPKKCELNVANPLKLFPFHDRIFLCC